MAGSTGTSESSIQSAVFQIEMGRGKRIIQWVLLVLLSAVLALLYTFWHQQAGDDGHGAVGA